MKYRMRLCSYLLLINVVGDESDLNLNIDPLPEAPRPHGQGKNLSIHNSLLTRDDKLRLVQDLFRKALRLRIFGRFS